MTRNRVAPVKIPMVKSSSVSRPRSAGSDVTRRTSIASLPPMPPITAPVREPATAAAATGLTAAVRSFRNAAVSVLTRGNGGPRGALAQALHPSVRMSPIARSSNTALAGACPLRP
jgi:hypothetical protein